MTESASAIYTLHTGKFLELQRDGRWEYVRRLNSNGGAAIVALTPAREIVLVEQYRIPVHARTIELPAGIVGDADAEADELPEAAAARELEEETGFRAQHIRHLITGPTAPGLTSEPTHMVLATGLTRVHAGGGTDSEDITTHVVPLDEAPAWLAARAAEGFAVEPKVYAGLFFAGTVSSEALAANDAG